MYNPVIGRWISRDPLANNGVPEIVYTHEYVAHRLQAVLAPYEYVVNNPILYADPSGLKCCVVGFKIDDAGVSMLVFKPAMVTGIFAVLPQGAKLGPQHGELRAGPEKGKWFVGRSYDLTIRITSDSTPEDCDIKRARIGRTEAFPLGVVKSGPTPDGPGELTVLRTPNAIYMHDTPGHGFPFPPIFDGDNYSMGANYEIVVTDKTGTVAGEAKVRVFVHISYTKGSGFNKTGNKLSSHGEKVHDDCC